MPVGGGEHGSGQGLFQRGFAGVFAPTALEERFARGIDVEDGVEVVKVEDQAEVGEAGVDAGALACAFTQVVADGIFDAQAGEVEALQVAAARDDVDAQGVLRGDPVGPVDATGHDVDVVFVAVDAGGDAPEDALGQAALQIEAHGVVAQGVLSLGGGRGGGCDHLDAATGLGDLCGGAQDATGLNGQQ